jgi:hypothetical protein
LSLSGTLSADETGSGCRDFASLAALSHMSLQGNGKRIILAVMTLRADSRFADGFARHWTIQIR